MPRFAANKMPPHVKGEYFELIRRGHSRAEAARQVGVSLSCGSLWFIDAGGVDILEKAPISDRFFNQDDRIEIADGLADGEPVKAIAARIGKSFQSVYRQIVRNRKPGGSYQPWYAHNQAHLRRRRPRSRVFDQDVRLRVVVAAKLAKRWSPGQSIRIDASLQEYCRMLTWAAQWPQRRWAYRRLTMSGVLESVPRGPIFWFSDNCERPVVDCE